MSEPLTYPAKALRGGVCGLLVGGLVVLGWWAFDQTIYWTKNFRLTD